MTSPRKSPAKKGIANARSKRNPTDTGTAGGEGKFEDQGGKKPIVTRMHRGYYMENLSLARRRRPHVGQVYM